MDHVFKVCTHKKVKSRFIDTLIREITSYQCFGEFCDTLDVFRELFLEVKKFSIENLVFEYFEYQIQCTDNVYASLKDCKVSSSS